MDESNYKRLTCSALACTEDHSVKGLCLKHYRKSKRVKRPAMSVSCAHCGQIYESHSSASMYCCDRCKQAAWCKKNPEKVAQRRQKQSPIGVRSFVCAFCQTAFTAGHKRKHCSPLCKSRANEEKIRSRLTAEHNKNVKPVNCQGCNVWFSPLRGYSTRAVYCSVCHASVPYCVSSAVRRTRLKAANVEVVDRLKVFDRDRWLCRLCGIKVMRKPYQPNSAELDHITPLSKGGLHSYANTQCACRKCNGAKGATPKGQALLFG